MPEKYNSNNFPQFIPQPAERARGKKIILASQSPRRKQLLEWAEVSFDIIVAATDESYPSGLSPEAIAIHIAKDKALAIRNKVLERSDPLEKLLPILAADTIVVLQNDILGKPKDREDAIHILTRLAGNRHKVITGVVLLNGKEETAFADITEVEFHPLSIAQIEYYVDQYEPYDKAGAYAIQEWIGVVGIKSISGDFYNVMGLPVSRVLQELGKLMGE
jgi:septum formation protein